MEYLKLVGRSFIYIVGIILVGTFLVSVLNYIGFFGPKLVTIFKILIPIISLFIGGFITGKRSLKKGWLEGLKLGIIFVIILWIFSFLGLDYKFELRTLIFYIILLIACVFGSMVGINKRKEEK